VLFHHRTDRTDDALDELAQRFADASGVMPAKQDAILHL
jgi:hypothetical protein